MSDGVFWPEFEAWLLAHGIDPEREKVAQVCWRPPHAGSTNGLQCLEVLTYALRDGKPYRDETGELATETRIVPMRHLPAVEAVRYKVEAR